MALSNCVTSDMGTIVSRHRRKTSRQFCQRMDVFQTKRPSPDPLPSDGRGNSQTRLSQLPKRLDTPTDGGRFFLSRRMGEGRLPGRGEGKCAQNPKLFL